MLSIIISSYQPTFFNALKENIGETCGIPFEVIKIENNGQMGICEAYNRGAEKAQYDNLLFLHEDVLFHTKNWGNTLINLLKKGNTGTVGLAGSNYVPYAPSTWNNFPIYSFNNIIQSNKLKTQSINHEDVKNQPQKVYTLDGVFLACTKNKFEKVKFNESIKGFHGYDLDFSLQMARQYQNFIINNIRVEHFSEGNPNEEWFKNLIQVRRLNQGKFYLSINPQLEETSFILFIKEYLKYNGLSVKNLINTLEFHPYKRFKIKNHFSILKVIYQYFISI